MVSGQTVAAQLDQARATLADLEADLPTLESGLESQNAELERVRREARAGRVDFEAVVTQQTRRDAAHGILQQHLAELASTRALIEELERAEWAAGAGQRVRDLWGNLDTTRQDYHALTAKVEKQISEGVKRLLELNQTHRAAQMELTNVFRQVVQDTTGLTSAQVGAELRNTGRPVEGEASGMVSSALHDFAVSADPAHAPELLALVRDAASGGSYGPSRSEHRLEPVDAPLLMKVLRTGRV